MKRFSLIVVVFTVLNILGCSSANWDAKVDIPQKIKVGDAVPVKIIVRENGQPVSGLAIKAVLEMKRMDHGSEQVILKEQEKGEYVGMAKLSMGGDWVADVEMSKDGTKKEFTYDFKTEGIQ